MDIFGAEEALNVIGLAHRQAMFAGRSVVTERDACKALMETLEDFAPTDGLSFHQTEVALAKDINTFALGSFPSNFVGLPLPPDATFSANWRFRPAEVLETDVADEPKPQGS